MPQYQAFSLILDKSRWEVEDVYSASNLLHNRLSPDTFRSRIDKLNGEVSPIFARMRRVNMAMIIMFVAPFIIVGILVAIIVSKAVTLSLAFMLSFFALAFTSFLSGALLTFWLRKIAKDASRRAAEVVKEFAREDQGVGVNWVHKFDDVQDRINLKQWIEVQVWTGICVGSSQPEFLEHFGPHFAALFVFRDSVRNKLKH
ncbi:hypothetical protein BJ742DRAFT_796329 [Cladochytrium replicatum]|nr:hypothetical protein BJ742DRAFT_796329 [Cladochytrium replicatum]